MVNKVQTGDWPLIQVIIILVMMVAVVAFIVLVERGERRIPVQYAKRVIGRRMMGGQSTHLPLKVNAGGVIPVIFASSLLAFPQTLMQVDFVKNSSGAERHAGAIGGAQPLYYLLYTALIIFFCFFYVSIIFNPNEAADNMRKYGGFIPGIRPGKNTAEYMNKILTKITVVGGLYLSILSLLPQIMISRHQAAAPAAGRELHRRAFPALAAGRPGRELLFRRHLAADRGGRGDGHGEPDRGAVDHAPLRRLHAARGPDPRPAQQRLRELSIENTKRNGGPLAVVLFGSPGSGKVPARLLRKCLDIRISRREICSGSISKQATNWGAKFGRSFAPDTWFQMRW